MLHTRSAPIQTLLRNTGIKLEVFMYLRPLYSDMMNYPKVPRVGIDVEPPDFWDNELFVTEKTDGSLFRFCLYLDSFQSWYPQEVVQMDPSHGDIVAGTSNSVRWVVSENEISGETETDFYPTLTLLQEANTDEMMRQYEEYGPLVYFGEAMTGHLIDYDSPPELLGFDVYSAEKDGRDSIETPSEISESLAIAKSGRDTNTDMTDVYAASDWAGFVSTEEAMKLFEQIGVEPIHYTESVPTVDGCSVDQEDITVPQSQFAEVKAEGLVFRSQTYRVKVRSDLFKEVRSHHSNTPSGGDADPASQFINEFATPIRIVKQAKKIAEQRNTTVSVALTEVVAESVWDDIWAEEWRTIKQKQYPIKNSKIRGELKSKTASLLTRFEENESVIQPEKTEQQALVSFS